MDKAAAERPAAAGRRSAGIAPGTGYHAAEPARRKEDRDRNDAGDPGDKVQRNADPYELHVPVSACLEDEHIRLVAKRCREGSAGGHITAIRNGPGATPRPSAKAAAEGQMSVSSDAGTVTAGPGEIINMPKGVSVNIRSHDQGAVTAYVTFPHWQEA